MIMQKTLLPEVLSSQESILHHYETELTSALEILMIILMIKIWAIH